MLSLFQNRQASDLENLAFVNCWNLTQFIEDGFEKGEIPGSAFVDLSATYDTVNLRIFTEKLFEMTGYLKLTLLISNILPNR